MSSQILLSEMLQSLRAELQTGIAGGEKDSLTCRVNALELELDVVVQREGLDAGPVKFYVVEGNVDDDNERSTHTFRIRLGPSELEPERGGEEGTTPPPGSEV